MDISYLHNKFIPEKLLPATLESLFQQTGTSNHWANESTMRDYVTKVIVLYVEKVRAARVPRPDPSSPPQPALVIFDVLSNVSVYTIKGQMCQSTIDLLMENTIHFVHVPPNCTDRLQPLDLSVNKPCKNFMRNKFIEWYFTNVCEALEQTNNK